MDFLSIFLEDFRGPRKTVFLLKIVVGQILNFQGLNLVVLVVLVTELRS